MEPKSRSMSFRIPVFLALIVSTPLWTGCGGSASSSPPRAYSFSQNIRVSDFSPGSASASTPFSGQRGIAVHGTRVTAIWTDTRSGGVSDIYSASSTDGGTTWGTNRKVSDDNTAEKFQPTMTSDAGGNLYAAWVDLRGGQRKIMFSRSTDGGSTWSANARVDDDTSGSFKFEPAIGIDNAGTCYVAWSDNRNGNYDIYISQSTDGGTTWSADVRVSDDPGSEEQGRVSMHIEGASVFLAWVDSRNGSPYRDVYFSCSTDGTTWTPNRKISDTTGGTVIGRCSLAGAGSRIALAWNDDRSGKREVYLITSADGGATWDNQAVRIHSDTPGEKQDPYLLVRPDGTAFVTWWDTRDDGGDIYFAYSLDGGKTWRNETRVNSDPTGVPQYYGTIALDDGGNIYIVWEDYRYDGSNGEVYFSRGT
ncbi:MAG: hypothetical protein Kow00128_07630 [Deltaproteobacteria bacterium]